jgi:hypothetical protein
VSLQTPNKTSFLVTTFGVSADPNTRKFSLAVLPADEAFRRTFLKDYTPLRPNGPFATFPKSTTPQTLDDGDAVSLELLVNSEFGRQDRRRCERHF